ncbi:glycosyltransferase family 25 protein [Allochromatium palmeri]|uniref:glycosyltransferase family 25 protein n=1 Tax=Allochromatium palmeri TaxID=231048 RepID=UPI0016423893|nr:glycosyltransferase family 25 protein [Allochromatium palmeri]
MLTQTPHLWINRQVDVNRRIQTLRWLSQHHSPHQRIEAITPKTLPRILVQKVYAQGNSVVELACLSSHLKAVRIASELGEPQALILEDDIRSHYLFDTDAIIASAPSDWEILQLNTSNAALINFNHRLRRQHRILWQRWEQKSWSTGAYLINRQGMQKLMSRFLTGYPASSDLVNLKSVHRYGGLLADYVIYRFLNAYCCTFPLFIHDTALGSTLHPEHIERTHQPAQRQIIDIYRTDAGNVPFAIRPLTSPERF